MAKFDKISNYSVHELGKVMGPANAEKFEAAVKMLTDPWAGKSGLSGKIIVDLIKGIPAAIGSGGGGGAGGGDDNK